MNLVHFAIHNHELMMTTYVAGEMLRVIEEKNPSALDEASTILRSPELAWFDAEESDSLDVDIRDPNDKSILATAILYDVDIIISGDKDFTSLEIDHPRIMTPAEFITEFMA